MKKTIIICIFAGLLDANVILHQKEFTVKKTIKSWIEFKNENLTRQKYDFSCGSASLSTVLKFFYGINVSEKEVLDTILKSKGFFTITKKRLESQKFSLSFFDLAKFSNYKGFKAIGLALNMEALKKLKAPVILFVKIREDEHFTVFKNIDKNYVYLADPSFGNIKVKIAKFKEMFFQRDDLTYPGKILAIIPIYNEQKKKINYNFLKINKSSKFIYENIKDSITSF